MDELRKTSKVAPLHKIEKGICPLEQLPQSHAAIIDGIAVVQMFKAAGLTFGQLADGMLHSIINACKDAARIDIVFDVYKQVSIKNAERVRRCKNKLIFKDIIPTW